MSNVIELNDSNFDFEVLNSELPVLVDFYAPWCGPCRNQIPIIGEVSESLSGKVKVVKVNVDEVGSKATEYNISSIPALMVFKGGKVVESMIGLHSKQALEEILNKYI